LSIQLAIRMATARTGNGFSAEFAEPAVVLALLTGLAVTSPSRA
jgi:hypothetical protein